MSSDEQAKEDGESRNRKPTAKGLANQIDNCRRLLHQEWKNLLQTLKYLENKDNMVELKTALAQTSTAISKYNSCWQDLIDVHKLDTEGEHLESFERCKIDYYKNSLQATEALAKGNEAINELLMETLSSISTSKSKKSTTSSQHSNVSDKSKAAAEASAANEYLRYTKEISQKQAQRAKLKAKREAEDADLEAEIEILKAERNAAETTAKAEALSDTEVQSTSPNDTANDHVKRFEQRTNDAQNKTESSDTRNKDLNSTGKTIAEAISAAMNLNKIPVPEPSIFSGDPLKYPDWKISFKSLIEDKNIHPTDRIHYLKKYLSGPAKEAVSGYFLLKDESAFQKAKDVLETRYGDPFMVAEAFRNKLDKWPKIDSRNPSELQKLSDFLKQCSTAMEEIPSLEVLNDTREINRLLEKLPNWICNRWKRSAVSAKKIKGKYPGLKDFSTFLATESDIVCDPALCSVKKSSSTSTHDNKPTNARSMATEVEKLFCVNCNRPNHTISECRKFYAKSHAEKEEYIKLNGLCYGCLIKGHRAKECPKRAICQKCKKKHPTCLHRDKPTERSDNVNSKTATNDTISATSNNINVTKGTTTTTNHNANVTKETASLSVETVRSLGVSSRDTTSMIVPVWISTRDNPSEEFLTYALLDSQSDSTFITNDLARKLNTQPMKATLRLTTMTSERKIIQCDKYNNLQVRRFDSEDKIKLPNTFTRQAIPAKTSHIPTNETARWYNYLEPIVDLIPPPQSCEFGLLIGYNCSDALAPINYINNGNGQPYAIETKLGWSIVGNHEIGPLEEEDEIGFSHKIVTSQSTDATNTSTCHFVIRTKVKELGPGDAIKALQMDFNTEESQLDSYSLNDQKFLNILSASAHVNTDNHIEMPLPFKKRPELPDNKCMALHRLHCLKKRFTRDQRYFEHYKCFMDDIIKNGDAEIVCADDMKKGGWYIPHHGVYHPKKPDKLRVVFDCSARFQNTSLNDHLLTGPDLTNNLVGVLCRFRQEDVAIMCDIERMFHQFHVNVEDRDYLRFLWWDNGDVNTEPITYRMKVHIFGAGSSPGCANFGLKHIADLYCKSDQEDAKEFLKENFYVDDGLKSVSEPSSAIKLIKDTTSICADGSLRLHKFISNNREVMSSIPKSEQAKDVKDLNLLFHELPIERALGIQWCVESDVFQFRIELKDQPLTRRGTLSTIASVYDPLGFLAPFILKGKQILQQMCKDNADWDDPLSDELRPQWERWRTDLKNLEMVKVDRCFKPKNFGPVKKIELHHFSDASTSGYGQCSYIRLIGDSAVHSTLIMGKSRVTPLKTVTIPRLELQAAVVSSQVGEMLNKEIKYKNKPITNYYWTDSKVVLGYINNDSRRFHIYVANRVQRIRNTTRPDQWNYVSTLENPADLASRGSFVKELTQSSWFTGPEFLRQQEVQFINCPIDICTDDPEVKGVLKTNAEPVNILLDRITKFSSWSEALGGVTALRRFILRKKKLNNSSRIEELKQTERIIIKQLQQQFFKDEIHRIKENRLKEKGHLWKLDPYLDEEDVLRVGGRLRQSTMNASSKHQIILPRESHITSLLIKHYHEQVAHQGRGMTINAIRSSGYWIVGLSAAVSSHIHKCIICRRLRGKVFNQKMSNLPKPRVNPSPPFSYCAMDCCGPFLVTEGRKELKKYGVIFTCMSSRAIHIEMVDNMSTDAFINALRCMIAIRGRIRQIFCDQGTNFLGASNELTKSLKEVKNKTVKKFFEDNECEFVFNTPSASHMNGVVERQIRSFRNVFNAILLQHKARLDTSSLRTFFYEAMAIVNNRPLTVENINDPNRPEPLTPNHLLTMKSELYLPPAGEFVKEDLYARKRWRKVQQLANEFWSRWKQEYLQGLQIRTKWNKVKRNFQVGDIVLLKEEDLVRGHVKLARIVETIPSQDNLIRKVKLLLSESNLTQMGKRVKGPVYVERPIHKLVLLLENP